MTISIVTPQNVLSETLFCAKNPKKEEFKVKQAWLEQEYKHGLRICILRDGDRPVGYIEYTAAEYAWRPVKAPNYLFVHCMYIYSNKDKGRGMASQLVQYCVDQAKDQDKNGVAVFTSKGTWMADKRVFEKNGFTEIGKLDRFELMAHKHIPDAADPEFIDWTQAAEAYQGWHLTYTDQCPWHLKSVADLQKIASEQGINLQVKKLSTHYEAQQAPSGFGGFNLIYNGKLLEDHYLSGTRFKTILKKVAIGTGDS